MKKLMVLAVFMMIAVAAFPGMMINFTLDCREGTRMVSVEGKELCYDASWYAEADQIRITDNGVVVETGTAGCYDWKPDPNSSGRHVLKLEAFKDGQVVATETAEFSCYSVRNETEVVVADGAVEIGDLTFEGGQFTSVMIPSSVTKIAATAFEGCNNIVSVSMPTRFRMSTIFPSRYTKIESVGMPDDETVVADSAYYGCSGLKSAVLADGVLTIGSGAFRGCSSLEEINLPASVQSIGADAYYGCSNVVELNIPDGVTSIGNTAFKDCTELRKVSIPDSVTTIGNSAFAGCANVRTVSMPTRFRMSTIFPSSYTAITAATMPEGTTKVADNAYYGCAALTSVALPNCVTAIGNNAFRACTALNSVAFPAGLLTIGEYAYYGCSGLSSVEIPQSVTQIGANAFGGCNGITSVTVPECVTSVKTTFPNAYQQITSVGLTRTCESIPSGMFNGCAALASITFPPDISSIGASAFSGCVGLSEIAVPSTVKEIGENAFLNCTSLEAVSITSSVEMLGATAFKGCAAIKTVVLERADKPLKVLFPDAYRTIENLTVKELTIEAADFFDGCESLVGVDAPEDCELYVWTFKTPKFDGDWWIENGWVLGYARETEASFVLPDELTKFGGGAFDGNEEIVEVTFGINTEVAGGFSNCPELQIVNFGGNERRIGAYAFWGDTYLDNVTIPASVEEIGKEAFLNCSYIQDLAFEGGVRDIGAGAFSNCASLISLELKDGGKRIGENAFYGCWRLMSVRLPLSLEQIGNNAFKGLRNLTGVTVPTHVKTMKEIFPDRYSSITSVVIPEGETDIIDGMFDGCSALTSIVIPNSVTNVGARAFGGCSSLVKLGLPDGVRGIGASALTGCSKIKDFTLPKNLESVGDAAFSSCSLLTTMVIPETVTQIGAGIVPYSLRSLYFLGNAPVCVGNPLNGTYSGLTVYVIRGTKGWDGVETSRVLPETWNGRAITSWTPNQFDVIFDANGGEPATYTVQEIADNSYAFPKAVPTRTGYDFAGWWTEREGGAEVKTYTKVTATKSHTLYAHWELRDDVVIVNFNANGGTITPLSKVYVVGYPFVDLPVPTRRGYRFAGWRSETGAAVSEKTIATAQMSTLVASWTANGYTVVFHSNDGADSQVSQSFAYGVETTLRRNTFTHKDHAFVGWATVADGDKVYDDADAVVNLAEVDGSVIHLYAVWIRTVVNYAVRFDGNGGGGSMDNENFTEGEVKCLTANAFVRTGFIFVGWSLTPDGEVAYEDGEEVSNLPFGTDHTLSLYAVWIAEDEFVVSKPVVNVPQGGTFDTETFLVTLSCATKGADIYYSTNGRTPRVSEQSRYGQPFEITDTTTIIAVAVRYGKLSAYTEVTITKVDPVVLTLETSLDEPKLKSVTTGGDADWTAVREEFARVGGACARSGSVGVDQRTWLEATVSGKGELTFYWRVSCEHDERGVYSYDHLVFTAKDARKEFKIDGVTDWIQQKVTFDTEGEHAVRWEYVTDDWEEPGFADCGWVDGVVWTPSAAPTVGPTVEGDEGATVTGDVESGFIVKPSEGMTAVEVTIPGGIDAGRVTVEVSPKVASVKPNGAKVKIVSGGSDITEFLNVPAADGNGVVDLAKATVKEEIVKEVLDVEKGAKVELNMADPKLTTTPTRVGLFYQLREGKTLGGMKDGDSTVGDGQPWLPKITVKGGNSAFYSIGVGKGK